MSQRHRLRRDKTPTLKMTGVGISGTLVTVVVWIAHSSTGVDIPPDIASVIVTAVAFAIGYWLPPDEPAPSPNQPE